MLETGLELQPQHQAVPARNVAGACTAQVCDLGADVVTFQHAHLLAEMAACVRVGVRVRVRRLRVKLVRVRVRG
jgi:hypothetical protein